MQPQIHLSPLAIILAVLSSFILGFVWYSLLFNKSWRKEMMADEQVKMPASKMILSLVLNLIGTVLMVWVFAHNIAAWDPRTWGHSTPFTTPFGAAMMSAIFTWVGFYIPQDLNKISFQNRSWKLFFIDTSFNLASLMISAFILIFL